MWNIFLFISSFLILTLFDFLLVVCNLLGFDGAVGGGRKNFCFSGRYCPVEAIKLT